jgi:hypothetical protein
MKKLTISDFASSFDTSEETFSSKCKAIINDNNFYYKELEPEELDNLYLVILKRIELDNQKIDAKKRTKVWQNGWEENLEEFINSGYDEESLVPKFIRES